MINEEVLGHMMTTSSSYRICSFNARGLNNYIKRKKLFLWCTDNKIDIVLLQETYCTKGFSKIFNSSWKGIIYHSYAISSHSKGVAILFRQGLRIKISNVCSSDNGRKLLINTELNGIQFCVICLYAPNSEVERNMFFLELQEWISDNCCSLANIILAGDFNCCLDENDRNTFYHLSDKSRKALKNLLMFFHIYDV